MNNNYRYCLDDPRVTGRRQQKTTCPQCGRKRCFVRYVDTQRDCQYVDNRVGRCDHEHSCGYHYKPAEFFRDQPWARPDEQPLKVIIQQPSRPVIIEPLPEGYMAQSHSPHSTFWQWFCATCAQQLGVSEETNQRLYNDYHIGATRRGEVIFWQVDEHQRIRTGHIMQYRTDGHREGYQGWVHARMIRQGLLRQDFPLVQCFFGQHLLPTRPDATVCLVESEKTALIMAAVHPEHLWLSTCGSGGLNAQKCQCLKGRRVVLFPDSGCLEKWSRNMQSCNDISYTISDHLEQYPANTDLADLLLHPP